MFDRIIQWAINNRFLVVIALLATCVAILLRLPSLKLDAFPDVTNVQVSINTEAPGLAAQEVEQLITFPIEAVMYALPTVEEVRSISKTGLSGVTVVFKEGTDIYFARQLVFERLQAARELIPDGVGLPEMGPNTTGLGQIYQYLLKVEEGYQYSVTDLRSLNDWVVKLLLIPAEGVTDVLSFGGEVKQYQVNINPARLLSYNLSIDDVIAAINQNNANAGGWYLNRGQEQLVIRAAGWIEPNQAGIEQIGQIPLKSIDGVSVVVSDVATVELGDEIRQGAVTMSQRDDSGEVHSLGEVVTGIILKQTGANTQQTIENIENRVALVNQALPEGVSLQVIYDQSSLVNSAVNTVVQALIAAFVFISIVLALFLLNLRATLLVLISIPIAVGLALLVMIELDLSANLMSLGGLAVAIGMLVDGSVVVVENVVKHRQVNEETQQVEESSVTVFNATREVARSVFFATLIILVVFLPLFSFEGVEAKLFEPMAETIIFAMISALLVALIVSPALATYFFSHSSFFSGSSLFGDSAKKLSEKTPNSNVDKPPLGFWQHQLGAGLNAYKRALHFAIRKKFLIAGCAGVLLLLSLLLIPRLGTEFVPELEEGTINLRVTLAPSSSLQTALSVAPKLEALLLEFPEVRYALSRVGRPEIGGDPEPVNNIEIYIGLTPVNTWISASNRADLQHLMEEKLSVYPGLLLNFSQPIATRVDELLSGVKAQLAIKLFGPDLSVLESKGQEIEALVREIPGAADVALEQIAGEAQLVIRPDRRRLSRYGLSVADITSLVNAGLGGQAAGQVINGNERYDIYVRLDESHRNRKSAIEELRLQTPSGAWVRLIDVASVDIESGPPQIRREEVQRRLVIQANVQGRDMGSVVADIQNALAEQIELPAGYSVSYGGQFESQQRAEARLSVVVPLSILLIAVLLYLAFGSVSQALLILVNVPLAVIGGIVALWVSGQYLSVPSSVGFITLFGVSVLNAVVLVESINRRLSVANSIEDAIIDGAVSRLRPVLMTAITSALGLIPILLSNGIGSEIQKPLATVIVGGLVTSTALTLVILPCLYAVFSQQKIQEAQKQAT